MTQLEKLYRKRDKQKALYCKLRYAYPEIARECKRNVMLINKQIRLLKVSMQ